MVEALFVYAWSCNLEMRLYYSVQLGLCFCKLCAAAEPQFQLSFYCYISDMYNSLHLRTLLFELKNLPTLDLIGINVMFMIHILCFSSFSSVARIIYDLSCIWCLLYRSVTCLFCFVSFLLTSHIYFILIYSHLVNG